MLDWGGGVSECRDAFTITRNRENCEKTYITPRPGFGPAISALEWSKTSNPYNGDQTAAKPSQSHVT